MCAKATPILDSMDRQNVSNLEVIGYMHRQYQARFFFTLVFVVVKAK